MQLCLVLTLACHRPAAPRPTVDDLLLAPPLVGRPTATTVTINVVASTRPIEVVIEVEHQNESETRSIAPGEAIDIELSGLEAGRAYRYRLVARSGDSQQAHDGRFVTQRAPGEPFSFAIISDPHLPIPAAEWLGHRDDPMIAPLVSDTQLALLESGSKLRRAGEMARELEVDFTICLGDRFYLHDPEFNPPFPSADLASYAHIQLRRFLGEAGSTAAFFAGIGNWDGENGWHPVELRNHAIAARTRLLPNPTATTYRPLGGGMNEDYFAWHWGDALLVVLNVMSYTTTRHTLDELDDGTAADWTLGAEQLTWFSDTLAASNARVKLVFAHHPVGGNGGDELNSAYGRGGGRAARIGEQARVHQLMLEHQGTVFFYGHDHVFTDMEVDGLHYTLVGSVGAPWMFPTSDTGYDWQIEQSGFTAVELSPSRLDVRQLSLDGEILHHYSIPFKDEVDQERW